MHDAPVVQVRHGLRDLLQDVEGALQRVFGGLADHLVEGGGVLDTRHDGQVWKSGASAAEQNDVVVSDVPQHVDFLVELLPHSGQLSLVGLEQDVSVPVPG